MAKIHINPYKKLKKSNLNPSYSSGYLIHINKFPKANVIKANKLKIHIFFILDAQLFLSKKPVALLSDIIIIIKIIFK